MLQPGAADVASMATPRLHQAGPSINDGQRVAEVMQHI